MREDAVLIVFHVALQLAQAWLEVGEQGGDARPQGVHEHLDEGDLVLRERRGVLLQQHIRVGREC